MLENKESDQALKLQAKLNGDQEQHKEQPSKIQRLNSIPCQCDNVEISPEAAGAASDIIDNILKRVYELVEPYPEAQAVKSEQLATSATTVEIDCTAPEITVAPRNVEIEVVPSASGSGRKRSSKIRKSSDSSGLKR